MSRLTFDPVEHRYFLDGEEVPGVTSVLADVGITNYRFVNQEVLQRAARFGTAVHRATELWDKGVLDMDSVHPALMPYLKAWIRFREDFGFDPDQVEVRVFCERYRYAGTADRVGVVTKGKLAGKRTLVDIKSGMLLPGVAIQTAAYTHAYNALNKKQQVARRLCVKLDDSGYIIEELTEKSDFSTWLACLQVYNFKKTHNIK